MIKRILLIFSLVLSFYGKSQCPQVYNHLGVLSSNPYWLSCSGSTLYTLNFQSNTSWGPYTIVWGDGSPNHTAGSYVGNSIINHTYTSVGPDTFALSLQIPSLNCTLTGVVVMEEPVNASVTIPLGGLTQGCAPITLQFNNSSIDASETSKYIWNFGDGSPPVYMTYTNAGATVSHLYPIGSVNCQTAVTLQAWNYCSLGSTTTATYSPIQIYGRDVAAITPDRFLRCWPDNVFTFSNTTTRNCVPQGNTFQREEYWNFGNFFGGGMDLIVNWSPWPPTNTVSATYTSVGTYSVMLRDSNFCGVDTAIINISILNAPVAGVIAPAGPKCQNTAVTFTNSSNPGYAYLWNFGTGGGFVNLGNGNKTFTYTTPGFYTVQVAAFIPGGGASCTSTANVVIEILPSPVTNFTYSPAYGCTSLSGVSFTDTSVGAVAWNWNFGNANTSTLQAPPSQNYPAVGAYTVTLVVTGSNTCVQTKTSSIVVHPNPIANFSPTITCAEGVTNFTNTSTVTGTNPIITYTWNYGDGSPNVFLQHPSHTFSAAAIYSVQLTVSTAFCSGTITKTVTVNVKPTSNFVYSPLSGCSPLPVSFTNTSANASTYLWDFGTVPTSTSNLTNPNFTYTNALQTNQTFTATLIAISNQGCSDTIKQNITVLPVPAVTFTSNSDQGCSPLPITFTNNTIGATTYSWNFGDGNSSIAANPTHTYNNNGNFLQVYMIQLVATNSVGCSSSVAKTLTVYPKPNYTLAINPSSGCAPLSISFPTLAGASSYTWNFGDGSPVSNSSNPVHVYTNTTVVNQTYTVNLIAANSFGCSDTTQASVAVLFSPVAGYTTNALSGCSPLAMNFTNTSTGNNTNNWSFGNGQSSNSINTSFTFTNISGAAASSYSVKLLVSNSNNCKDSLTKVVNLFAKPQSTFNIDLPACSPKVMTFTNNSSGASSYKWDFGSGDQSTQTNPVYTFTNAGPGNQNYTVTLVAENSDNCTDTSRVQFVLYPDLNFNIVSNQDSGCSPLKVNFPAIAGIDQYQWIFGDGGSSSAGSNNHNFINTGVTTKNYTVQLIGKDINGCADTNKKVIKVFSIPEASFQASPLNIFISNQSVQFTNSSSGASTYLWDFGNGAASTENSPLYSYPAAGEFIVTLIAKSSNGCRDTFSLSDKIIALEESMLQIPNAFTPNQSNSPGTIYDPNDKSNDIFHPVLKGVEKFKMSIYSRWGELLFETLNPDEGWDGYYRGKLCVQDVYVWKISATFLDGKKFDKTGDLLLMN